jgi:hypothetical protein
MGREQWTTADVAEHLGVAVGTVRSYAARGQMPPPDGVLGRTPWWWAATIRGWQRPGRGSRTDLRA